MIKIIKYFLITLLVSISIVWLSNNPGRIEIYWKEYLIQTNIIGLVVVIFIVIGVVLFWSFINRKVRELPQIYDFNKKQKYLNLGNDVLDDIAIDLVISDSEGLERNSRKLKKYFGNNLFSTFILFFSSLLKNNIDEANKYLRVLEAIPKADYIAKRSRVLLLLKENDFKEAKDLLENFCKKYKKDIWFFEKLCTIYVLEKNWKLASETIEKLYFSKSIKIKNLRANLTILAGTKPSEAIKISNKSIKVIIETVKFYIDESNLKKSVAIIDKNWKNFICFEIIKIFMDYKIKNSSESLKRFKLVAKVLKRHVSVSNESKFSMAYAAYCASIWGESEKFLDSIPRDEWDSRIMSLYEKLLEKSSKVKIEKLPKVIKSDPMWNCEICNLASKEWRIICSNCNSIDSFSWPKALSNNTKKIQPDLIKTLLKNPLGHLPKMK